MVIAPFTDYSFISYFIFFILTFSVIIYLFFKKSLIFINKMTFILVPLILILAGIFLWELLQLDRNFYNSISDILKRILVVFSFILLVSNISDKVVLYFFKKLLKNAFVVGGICLIYSLVSGVYLINENAVSFLILPYSGYLIFKQKKIFVKLIYYLVLIVILYLTDGRAALLAFILTPFFLLIIKSTTLKGIYFLFFSIGITFVQIVYIDKLGILDKVLSGRILIQEAYIDNITDELLILLIGSGEFILGESIHLGLGPHQTWLGLIWTFGIIGAILNLIIIIYSLKFKLKKENLYIDLIVMYIFILQLFESINLGGISYPSFLLLITILFKIKLYKGSLNSTRMNGALRKE